MGDIALPNINYETEWQRQRLNKTFQQELEQLKQEVYNEGLQVEEEGLTDIIRKKTKLPDSDNLSSEKNKNDAVLVVDSGPSNSLPYAKQSPNGVAPSDRNSSNVTAGAEQANETVPSSSESRAALSGEEKPEKNVSDVFRHIDEKKIQSDTKDIQTESENILQTRRTVLTTSTSTVAPVASSTTEGSANATAESEAASRDDSFAPGKRRRRRHQNR